MKKLAITICLLVSAINITIAQTPTIDSMIMAFSSPQNIRPLYELLNASDYTYQTESLGHQFDKYVLSKNCKVVKKDYLNCIEYMPTEKTNNPNIIIVNVDEKANMVNSINSQVYSNTEFREWIAQLKALGYKSSGGGEKEKTRTWEYYCKGKPSISIWNDYSTTYMLTISK